MKFSKEAITALTMNTIAFTICFMCWMMNGVLITFLVDNEIYSWSKSQIGWLIGTPVLTGAVLRLPVGLLTDKYGGRIVYFIVMLLSAIPMYLSSYATTYNQFLLAGLGFGLTGTSFAVGIAYTSVWFKKEHQGTALGIFGAGNAGAAITSMGAPYLLRYVTDHGSKLENWVYLPRLYAVSLVVMAILFYALTTSKKVDASHINKFSDRLKPLKDIRVWRFGLYYFLVFGGFVALAQWLIPYYVNVYILPITTAGLMAAIFTLPSGVIRALGGWMSDKWGARVIMYGVLFSCFLCSAALIIPRMDIQSPGQGVMCRKGGEVTSVTNTEVVVAGKTYSYNPKKETDNRAKDEGQLIFPRMASWQEPVVKVGDTVKKKELLVKGITHIYFQANVWVFTFFLFIIGIMMGIGKAAVYKHIPTYFPKDVGVVGGIVGVLGGLGGFICPIIFGYLLEYTGIWTTCWMFFTVLSLVCLVWMHAVIQKMMKQEVPKLMEQIEAEEQATS